jgi:hypothetical protein
MISRSPFSRLHARRGDLGKALLERSLGSGASFASKPNGEQLVQELKRG